MSTQGRGWLAPLGAAVIMLTLAGTRAEAGMIRSTPRYTVTDLGDVPGGVHYEPRALNNSGQVVGTYWNKDHTSGGGWIYTDGVMRRHDNYSRAINDAGQMGAIGDNDINDRGHTAGGRDFRWPEGYRASLTNEMGTIDLGALDALRSEAYALNNRDQVVGALRYDDGSSSPFLYSDGVMTDLARPDSPRSYGAGAYDINDRGQVVGAYATAEGAQAFLYEDGDLVLLGALGGIGTSGASALNEFGQIVGWSSSDAGTRAFLYQDGVMFDLNDLVPPETTWTINGAFDINDLGQILVQGYNNAPGSRALLLTPAPVPEPTALATFGPIVMAICWRRRKQWSKAFNFRR